MNRTPKTTRRASPRIALRSRAVENPTIHQLIHWALDRGILQRLVPHETSLPPKCIGAPVIARLILIYKESLRRWKAKEQLQQSLIRARNPISQEVATWFANHALKK